MDEDLEYELHDENGEIVEMETHDMEDAEAQSVKATAKTDDKIKRAPARKGDKRNSEPMPKSKAGKVGALYDKINLLANEDVEKLYDFVMGDKYLEETDESQVSYEELDYEGDLDALVESEGTLSEEFKAKAGTIFESALNYRVGEEVKRLEEAYVTRLEEELDETREQLIESVDSYLNYAVDTFMNENELAIQVGLRTEIAENFMSRLKDLFEESYIDVPESKIDLVDELAEQVDELEDQLNESTAIRIAMAEELEDYQRIAIVVENTDGLTETQAAKLIELSESVGFDSPEEFEEKVQALKESHFKVKTKSDETIVEENEDDDFTDVESDDRMSAYNRAISRAKK